MLAIEIQANEDETPIVLEFEHSLVSISKWEAKHEKPFFGREAKTPDEMQSYIELMLLNKNAPKNFVSLMKDGDFAVIAEYMNSRQSGTTFREDDSTKPSSEIITSELIYYWLVQFNIPFEPVEEWHFSRLMNLIKIAGVKQSKPKKMSKQATAEYYRKLNEERRKQLGTSG